MIANFIKRAFGRVSLRGVARVQHASLTAARGSEQYTAGHYAWDSTGDRVQGGFIFPASKLGHVARTWAGS